MNESFYTSLASDYLKRQKTKGLAEKTIKKTKYCINLFYKYALETENSSLSDFKRKDFIHYIHFLKMKRKNGKHQYCKASIYGNIRILKNFFDYLLLKRIIQENPLEYIELKPPVKHLPSNILTEEELKRLLDTFPPTFLGRRNKMIVSLIYNTGLRVSEVCKLNLYDVDIADSILYIRNTKGGKNRLVPLNKYIGKKLSEYITNDRLFAGAENISYDSLFLTKEGNRLTTLIVSRVTKKATHLAGIEKRVTPHALRHTFATHMLKNGCSIRYIADILGHEYLSTTEIYTRVFPVDLQEMIDKYHPE